MTMMTERRNRGTRHARAFYAANGLNVATYDSRTAGFPGEIEFYVGRAVASGGPVLEVACGTGRVSWPIARAGIAVVGLDLSPAMLGVAEGKRAAERREVGERARFVLGDMTGFDLGETFALALVPFRAFQALLTPEAQRSALVCIRRHLRPGGQLVLDLFDPLLDLLLPGHAARRMTMPDARHPESGNVVAVSVLERVNEAVSQRLRERWLFTERTAPGHVVREEEEILEMRWSYRYEMRYLLELCGYVVEQELSDFMGAPPAYGHEQIWVARRA